MPDATDPSHQRVAVIGSPGGGKSTLATALARAMDLPLFHLDREHWRPGWTPLDGASWQARNAALAARERWVIDGNYGSTLHHRLQRATLVVWLDLPTPVCLAGAILRAIRYRRGGRPDMAEGCPERLDRAFLRFIVYIAMFRRRKREGIVRALAAGDAAVVHLNSKRARAAFLHALGSSNPAAQTIARLASSRMEMP